MKRLLRATNEAVKRRRGENVHYSMMYASNPLLQQLTRWREVQGDSGCCGQTQKRFFRGNFFQQRSAMSSSNNREDTRDTSNPQTRSASSSSSSSQPETPIPKFLGSSTRHTYTPSHHSISEREEKDELTHVVPTLFTDHFCIRIVKMLRWIADRFFKDRYIHRAMQLKPIASAPVYAINHIQGFRMYLKGEIPKGTRLLLSEAEAHQTHCAMLWEITPPTVYDRVGLSLLRSAHYMVFFCLYLVHPRTAHRLIAYLAEESTVMLTHMVNDLDLGKIADVSAPMAAIQFYGMQEWKDGGGKAKSTTTGPHQEQQAYRNSPPSSLVQNEKSTTPSSSSSSAASASSMSSVSGGSNTTLSSSGKNSNKATPDSDRSVVSAPPNDTNDNDNGSGRNNNSNLQKSSSSSRLANNNPNSNNNNDKNVNHASTNYSSQHRNGEKQPSSCSTSFDPYADIPNVPMLRDVVLLIRSDEMFYRDVHHQIADSYYTAEMKLGGGKEY